MTKPYVARHLYNNFTSIAKHLISSFESSFSKPTNKRTTVLIDQLFTINYNNNDPKSADDALQLAINELHTLADLAEAHFVSGEFGKEQQRLIFASRDLAKEYQDVLYHRCANFSFLNFEKLTQMLLQLKRNNITTRAGQSWSDIMRPTARIITYALRRYKDLSEHAEVDVIKEKQYLRFSG